MDRLNGKVAVVTGAARGIGRGIVERFLCEGADVLMVDVLPEAVMQSANELAAVGHGRVAACAIDLLEPDAVSCIREAAEEAFGSVDILVNNAGIGIVGRVEDYADAEWERVMAVNLTAPFRLCREFVPGMAARGFGRVINVTSFAATAGQPTDAGYAVSKAGLEALTRSVAVDYGPKGVTCNGIAPGVIVTPLSEAVLKNIDKREPMYMVTSVNKPVPFAGQPSDIAATAAFLASDDARYITGLIVPVDGGANTVCFVPPYEGGTTERFVEGV